MSGTQVMLTQQELNFLLRGLVPPEPTRINKSETRKLLVKSIFERWTLFYRMAMRSDIDRYIAEPQRIGARFERYFTEHTSLERRATLARMNSGDCGTTALAVGQTLEFLGFDVLYCDLLDHAAILVDGFYWDTLCPEGVPALEQLLAYKQENASSMPISNAELIHSRYLPYDELGMQMVETFVRMFSLNYKYPFTVITE